MARISYSRIGPVDWEVKQLERLKRDFGIRALLAFELITAVIIFTGLSMLKGVAIPEAFMGLAAFAAGFYFGNRSTMDKT
jgi:hypothetical protein